MRDFHKLRVWDQAHQATLEVYRATRTLTKEEKRMLAGLVRKLRAES